MDKVGFIADDYDILPELDGRDFLYVELIRNAKSINKYFEIYLGC